MHKSYENFISKIGSNAITKKGYDRVYWHNMCITLKGYIETNGSQVSNKR